MVDSSEDIKPMGDPWTSIGIPMGIAWDPMGALQSHGSPMGVPWASTINPWKPNGSPMVDP